MEPVSEAQQPGPGRTAAVVAALALVQFIDVLGVTVVVSALPRMLAGVGAPASDGGLVATGYAMLFGGLLMFGARLGDRLGHRRTIAVSCVVFAGGAALAGGAGSIITLTAGRCVQGLAAAVAVPSALSLLTRVTTTETMRARALSVWSAAGAAAGASGFVVGGVVTTIVGWRWIFWAMVLMAAVLTGAIIALVPPDTPGQDRRPLNLLGSGLLTGTVMAVVIATTLLPDGRSRWLGAVVLAFAMLLGLGQWAVDRQSSAPLLPRRMLALPALRRGTAGSALNTATTSAVTVLTLYLQDTLGHPPLTAAASLLPFSLAVVAASPAAPALIRRFRREGTVAAGLGLIMVGTTVLLIVPDRLVVVGACMAVEGAGIGVASVAATSLGTDVPEADRATASGIINTSAQLGTAIGTAVLLLITAVSTGTPEPDSPAPRIAFAAAAVLALLGTVGFLRARRRPAATQPRSRPQRRSGSRDQL